MTANLAPDDVATSEAARLLGLPLHRVQRLVREGFVPRPVKGRVGLIAAACGHVAALRADARNLPTLAARRAAAKHDDAGRRAILDAEAAAVRDLRRLAKNATPERAAAIHAAADRIKTARSQALRMLRYA